MQTPPLLDHILSKLNSLRILTSYVSKIRSLQLPPRLRLPAPILHSRYSCQNPASTFPLSCACCMFCLSNMPWFGQNCQYMQQLSYKNSRYAVFFFLVLFRLFHTQILPTAVGFWNYCCFFLKFQLLVFATLESYYNSLLLSKKRYSSHIIFKYWLFIHPNMIISYFTVMFKWCTFRIKIPSINQHRIKSIA